MQKTATVTVALLWITLIVYVLCVLNGITEPAISTSRPDGIIVSEETENYGTENLTVDIGIPVISGLSNTEFEKELNNRIKSQVYVALNAAKEAAAGFWHEAEIQGFKPWPYVFYAEYTVNNLEGIFSLEVTTLLYTGGPGMPHTVHYNTDIKKNSYLSLGNLFKDDTYREIFYDYIITEMAKDPERYFIESFIEVTDKTKFFIRNNQLYITFAKYEVASGTTGEPEFLIPMEIIKDLLKPEYTEVLIR